MKLIQSIMENDTAGQVQNNLKKADGSDAGSSDVVNKSSDVEFSMMRNAINDEDKVTASGVADYLERAHELNNSVDTVAFGMETDDGEVVKVYVAATDADKFEEEMAKLLGMEDDIEEALVKLAQDFDIVDVVWPDQGDDTKDGSGADDDDDDDLDLDTAADLLGDDDDDEEDDDDTPPADPDDEDDAGTTTTKEQQMTIGANFLSRVLNEAREDKVRDEFSVPLDAQAGTIEARLKTKLAKQVLQLHVMAGAPGKYLVQFNAEPLIIEAADMMRTDHSIRQAFMNFFKALAKAKGYTVAQDKVEESLIVEATKKMKRGSFIQKLMEQVLVKLGMPEQLVVTTGPGIVGTNLYKTAAMISASSDLEIALRTLAMRMGVKADDDDTEADGSVEPVVTSNQTKMFAEDVDFMIQGKYVAYVEALLAGLGMEQGMMTGRGMLKFKEKLRGTVPPSGVISRMEALIRAMGMDPQAELQKRRGRDQAPEQK